MYLYYVREYGIKTKQKLTKCAASFIVLFTSYYLVNMPWSEIDASNTVVSAIKHTTTHVWPCVVFEPFSTTKFDFTVVNCTLGYCVVVRCTMYICTSCVCVSANYSYLV